MATDAVSAASTLIRAKAAAKKSTYKPLTLSSKKLPDLPKGQYPTTVISKRLTTLKTMNAGSIKKAAQSMGLDVKFGLDPSKWKENNPHLAGQLKDILALADEITKAKKAMENLPTLETGDA